MLKQYIETLKSNLGIEQALEANEDDSYSLHFEPDVDVTIKENPECPIMFYGKIAELPTHHTEEYLRQMMVANLFGRETGGAALGLDNEGKSVVLLNFLPEENYYVFHDMLEDFVNYIDAWRQQTIEFSEKSKVE